MSREAKPVSAIPQHVGLTAESARTDCMTCHDPQGEGAMAPLPSTHPQVWKKEEVKCTMCHTAPAAATASHGAIPPQEMQTQ